MSSEFKEVDETVIEKPQVFLKSITFNDDTQLSIKHNSIIVFTGANNSGKSQVLKDVEYFFDKSNHASPIVIKNFEWDYCGTIDETFLDERFYTNKNGTYQLYESESLYNFTKDSLQQYWENHTLRNDLHKLFIKRLSTEIRLTSSNALDRNYQPEKHLN